MKHWIIFFKENKQGEWDVSKGENMHRNLGHQKGSGLSNLQIRSKSMWDSLCPSVCPFCSVLPSSQAYLCLSQGFWSYLSLSLSSEPRACIWATQCPRFGVWLWTSEHLTFSTYHLPYLENQSNCCSHEHFSSFLLLTFISEQTLWFYYMCSQLFCLLLAPMSYIYLIRLKSSVIVILLPLCCCVGLGNNYLWFEWKLFHTCSCVWTLGLLLVLLFEREKKVAQIRLWEFIALSWFQFTTPSQLLSIKVKMWSCSFLLLPPSAMPPPP